MQELGLGAISVFEESQRSETAGQFLKHILSINIDGKVLRKQMLCKTLNFSSKNKDRIDPIQHLSSQDYSGNNEPSH